VLYLRYLSKCLIFYIWEWVEFKSHILANLLHLLFNVQDIFWALLAIFLEFPYWIHFSITKSCYFLYFFTLIKNFIDFFTRFLSQWMQTWLEHLLQPSWFEPTTWISNRRVAESHGQSPGPHGKVGLKNRLRLGARGLAKDFFNNNWDMTPWHRSRRSLTLRATSFRRFCLVVSS